MSISPGDQFEAHPAAPPDRGVGQAYLLLAICFYLMAAVAIPLQNWSPYTGIALTEAMMFIPAIVYVRVKGLPIAASLGWRPVSPAMVLAAVVLGAGGFGAATAIQLLLVPLTGRGPDIDLLNLDATTPLAMKLFALVVLPGICEETLFRGAAQGTLIRRGPANAVIITSLIFALFHLNQWNFLPLYLLSVVLGTIALRTGSTLPTMVAHSSANATAFLLVCLYGSENNPEAWRLIKPLSVVFVAALAMFLSKTQDRPAPLGPLASAPAGLSWKAIALSVACGAVLVVLLIAVAVALFGGTT